jgi:hypothetical protein
MYPKRIVTPKTRNVSLSVAGSKPVNKPDPNATVRLFNFRTTHFLIVSNPIKSFSNWSDRIDGKVA